MNYDLSRMRLAEFGSVNEFVFAELSHRLNPVVGWVRMSPDDLSKWNKFKVAAEQVGFALRAEGFDVSDSFVYQMIERFVFPVVREWVLNPSLVGSPKLDEALVMIADRVIG